MIYNYKDSEKDSAAAKKDVSPIEESEEEITENNTVETKAVTNIASKFEQSESKPEKPTFKPCSPTKNSDISSKVAMFEQGSPSKKDPALLSVSERKALFEKNKGAALIPKAAFAMAAPIKTAGKENTASNTSGEIH